MIVTYNIPYLSENYEQRGNFRFTYDRKWTLASSAFQNDLRMIENAHTATHHAFSHSILHAWNWPGKILCHLNSLGRERESRESQGFKSRFHRDTGVSRSLDRSDGSRWHKACIGEAKQNHARSHVSISVDQCRSSVTRLLWQFNLFTV